MGRSRRIIGILIFLMLVSFSFSQRAIIEKTKVLESEIQDGFEFAYDVNGKIYYPGGDTLTIIHLKLEYNYVVVSIRTLPPNPYVKPIARLEYGEFEIPMKWDQRRLAENRIIFHFYPEKWHYEVPSKELKIVLNATNLQTGEQGKRILYLSVKPNNPPNVKKQYFFLDYSNQ